MSGIEHDIAEIRQALSQIKSVTGMTYAVVTEAPTMQLLQSMLPPAEELPKIENISDIDEGVIEEEVIDQRSEQEKIWYDKILALVTKIVEIKNNDDDYENLYNAVADSIYNDADPIGYIELIQSIEDDSEIVELIKTVAIFCGSEAA